MRKIDCPKKNARHVISETMKSILTMPRCIAADLSCYEKHGREVRLEKRNPSDGLSKRTHIG